MIRFLEF